MERKPFPSETQERFIVRFPDGMRDRIAEAAKANNRSMNAEIVIRLQASFEQGNVDATASKIEESAQAIGFKPGTDEFASAVNALKGELRSLISEQTEELLANIVKMDQLRRTDPKMFQRLVDLTPPKE